MSVTEPPPAAPDTSPQEDDPNPEPVVPGPVP